jgi:membrane protein implicated in regulation of membrane protease activity
MVVGAALLGAEMVVDTSFYLVFFGIAALLTGVLAWLGVLGPEWAQWLGFGVLSVIGALTFRRRLYAMLRKTYGEVGTGTVGELAVARDPIPAGGRGRAELRGTVWEAHNTGTVALSPGESARVERVEGLVLELRRD